MSLAFIMLLPQLLAAGINTEQEIAAVIKSFHPGMSDPELNAILSLIVAGAQRHKALADADSGKT